MRARRRIALSLDLQWPYKRHTAIFAGAQRFANEQGWDTIIDEFVDNEPKRSRTNFQRYDGVIGRATRLMKNRLSKQQTPLVNVWASSPVREQVPGVFPDHAESGRLRAEHLLDRGFRNFATLTRRHHADFLETSEFKKLVRRAGLQCSTLSIANRLQGSESIWRRAERAISDWMDKWRLPIGLSVNSDWLARLMVQKCIERGWQVPHDVGIITGQNEVAICQQLQPTLTSVELGYERVGYRAAELLGKLITERKRKRNKAFPFREPIIVPLQGLTVRESTDFFAVDDQMVGAALAYIAANSHKAIRQEDVGRAVAVDVRTLQNRFRKVIDRPIVSVIRQVRIDRAKRELVQSDRSMTEIARIVGFGRPERMNEIFRRELGMSPSAFRKQRQAIGITRLD